MSWLGQKLQRRKEERGVHFSPGRGDSFTSSCQRGCAVTHVCTIVLLRTTALSGSPDPDPCPAASPSLQAPELVLSSVPADALKATVQRSLTLPVTLLVLRERDPNPAYFRQNYNF